MFADKSPLPRRPAPATQASNVESSATGPAVNPNWSRFATRPPQGEPLCIDVKTKPDQYSLDEVKTWVPLEDDYCVTGEGKAHKLRLTGLWWWHKYKNFTSKVANPKVLIDLEWTGGSAQKEVTVSSIDVARPTKIQQTFEIVPHPECAENDSVSIDIIVVQPERDKALSGHGTVQQLK